MQDADRPTDPPTRDPAPNLFQSDQRAEQVQAWAQRMKDKRAARQAADQPQEDATYWSTDALFAESRHVEESERLTTDTESHRTELLASLGLGPTASADDITRSFRSLAKLHHPDRYVDASPDVQAHHSDAMTKINSAYKALKLFAAES